MTNKQNHFRQKITAALLIGAAALTVVVVDGAPFWLLFIALWMLFEGMRRLVGRRGPEVEAEAPEPELEAEDWTAHRGTADAIRDDSLVVAKQQLNDAVEDLLDVIRNPEVLAAIGSTDRSNLAKYLTIAKLRLENAIAVVRIGDPDR